MKTNRILQTGIMMFAVAFFTLTGCKKETPDTDTSAASDNDQAESIYNSVFNTVDDIAKNTSGINRIGGGSQPYHVLSNCATITVDTVSNPKVVTIDFGITNCLCNDNVYRRGKIIAAFTGRYSTPGTTVTVTFDNFYHNNFKVEGNKTIHNDGINGAGHLSFSIHVFGSITNTNNQTLSWTSTRIREWIAGSTTINWDDDIYLITGTASGTGFGGKTFSANITIPLRIELSCTHIVSGAMDITPQDKPVRTIDWGTGACDDQATVTISGHTYLITLR